MDNWVNLRVPMPWLPLPPYFIRPAELPDLRKGLRRAGFKVFEAETAECRDEESLLVAIGAALPFPDYFGANWDAFDESFGDLVNEDFGAAALIIVGADTLARASAHAFSRSVHILQGSAEAVRREHLAWTRGSPEWAEPGSQFEVFFVGDFEGYRTLRGGRRGA